MTQTRIAFYEGKLKEAIINSEDLRFWRILEAKGLITIEEIETWKKEIEKENETE